MNKCRELAIGTSRSHRSQKKNTHHQSEMNHTRFLLGTSFFTTSSSFSIMLKVAATACGTTKLDQHGKKYLARDRQKCGKIY